MLEQHLVCAALEHPLSFLYDEIYFGSGLESAVMTLKNKGLLVCNISQDKSAQIWSYIGHEVLAHLNAVPLMQLIEWRKYLHFWFLLFVCACFFFFPNQCFHTICYLYFNLFIYCFPQKSPSTSVSIRAIETERYKVINQKNDEILEEIEENKAFFQVSTLLCVVYLLRYT